MKPYYLFFGLFVLCIIAASTQVDADALSQHHAVMTELDSAAAAHIAEKEAELLYHASEICYDTKTGDRAHSIYELGMWHLKVTEGIRLKPYKCSAGVWTIGWGHSIKKGEKFGKITVHQADSILRLDFQKRLDDVRNTYPFITDKHRQWAVAMLAFNIKGGVKALSGTKLERYLQEKRYADAADQLLKWDKAYVPSAKRHKRLRGLTKKRRFEALLLRGDPASLSEAFGKAPKYREIVISKVRKQLNS